MVVDHNRPQVDATAHLLDGLLLGAGQEHMKIITDHRGVSHRLQGSDYHRGHLWMTFRSDDGSTFDITMTASELASALRGAFAMAGEFHRHRGNSAGSELCAEVMRMADLIDSDQ